jgi:hypothetical protein
MSKCRAGLRALLRVAQVALIALPGALSLFSAQAQSLSGTALPADPVSAHSYHTLSLLNPAYAGALEDGAVFLTGQNLATTLDSLVSGSFGLGVRAPVGSFGGAISANFHYVRVPFTARFYYADLGFAYPVADNNGHRLLLGASLGLGAREVIFPLGSPPLFPIDRRNRFFPELKAGLWYTYEALSLGAGATHIGQPTVTYSPQIQTQVNDVYYLNAAYRLDVQGVHIIPSYMGRYAGSGNFLNDVQLDARFEDLFGVGLGYRVDLRRRLPFNPGFPIADVRFQQLLVSAEVGFDRFSLRGTFSHVLNQFAADRNNFEATLLYRFMPGPAPVARPVGMAAGPGF